MLCNFIEYMIILNVILRKIILLSALLYLACYGNFALTQGQLVLSGGSYITMDGGNNINSAYIVLENPSSNAITTVGAGGFVRSESEYHKIKWWIGSSTGAYRIPFVTYSGVSIPLTFQITSAGSGNHIEFSTYPTAVNNTIYPSMVTNVLDQNTETTDNSDYMIDRFWIIDAMNYSTRPDVNINFGYDPAECAGNICAPGALLAQRFNSNTNSWTDGGPGMNLYYGVDNGTDAVMNATVPGVNLYEAWNLVDDSNPLPVELSWFAVQCEDGTPAIEWETESELDSKLFMVQKSFSSNHWKTIGTVQAAGTSNNKNYYSFLDVNPSIEVAYYRLIQVDFDGDREVLPIESVKPCKPVEDFFEISLNQQSNQVVVNSNLERTEEVKIQLYDSNGKAVWNFGEYNLAKGHDEKILQKPRVETGLYSLRIMNSRINVSTKLLFK